MSTSENFYLADLYVWNVKDFGIYERFSAAARCVARYLVAGSLELAKKHAFDAAAALVQPLNLFSVREDGRRCMENAADIDALADIIYRNGEEWRNWI